MRIILSTVPTFDFIILVIKVYNTIINAKLQSDCIRVRDIDHIWNYLLNLHFGMVKIQF